MKNLWKSWGFVKIELCDKNLTFIIVWNVRKVWKARKTCNITQKRVKLCKFEKNAKEQQQEQEIHTKM